MNARIQTRPEGTTASPAADSRHPDARPTQDQLQPLLMDIPAAAAFAGIKERAMRHLFTKRVFPVIALGTRLYVRRSTFLDYLDSHTLPPATPR